MYGRMQNTGLLKHREERLMGRHAVHVMDGPEAAVRHRQERWEPVVIGMHEENNGRGGGGLSERG